MDEKVNGKKQSVGCWLMIEMVKQMMDWPGDAKENRVFGRGLA
jgi:hypothetical protein